MPLSNLKPLTNAVFLKNAASDKNDYRIVILTRVSRKRQLKQVRPFLLFQNCGKLSTMPNIAVHIFCAILYDHFLVSQYCEKVSGAPNIAAHIFRAILCEHFLVLQYRRKVSGALDIAAHIFHAILPKLFLVSQYRDQLVTTQYCRLLLFQRRKEFLPFGRNSFLFIGTLNEIRTHTP